MAKSKEQNNTDPVKCHVIAVASCQRNQTQAEIVYLESGMPRKRRTVVAPA
jgi:hypothetical protein